MHVVAVDGCRQPSKPVTIRPPLGILWRIKMKLGTHIRLAGGWEQFGMECVGDDYETI